MCAHVWVLGIFAMRYWKYITLSIIRQKSHTLGCLVSNNWLIVDCCVLFAVCCLLFVVCCLVFVVCCFVFCCVVFVAVSFVVSSVLFVVSCSLFIDCCLTFVIMRSLLVVGYVLVAVCCYLRVV